MDYGYAQELLQRLNKLEGQVKDLERLEHAMAQNHGYVGGAWQKDPLADGYSGDWTEEITTVSAQAGTNNFTGTVVPAGEIWHVQAISAYNLNSVSTTILITAFINGKIVYLQAVANPAAGFPVIWTGKITLSPGDNIVVYFTGCNLNDDLFLTYHAVRIDIDQ